MDKDNMIVEYSTVIGNCELCGELAEVNICLLLDPLKPEYVELVEVMSCDNCRVEWQL